MEVLGFHLMKTKTMSRYDRLENERPKGALAITTTAVRPLKPVNVYVLF